jgi:hypothetical protein
MLSRKRREELEKLHEERARIYFERARQATSEQSRLICLSIAELELRNARAVQTGPFERFLFCLGLSRRSWKGWALYAKYILRCLLISAAK